VNERDTTNRRMIRQLLLPGQRLALACGIPPEWLADVRKADEDTLLVFAQHLPAEAAEALLDLAAGVKPNSRPLFSPAATPSPTPTP
jgi:hypothetical protein